MVRMTLKGFAGAILAAALFLALSSCTNALVDELSKLASTANQPTAQPAAGTLIPAHEKIVLTFTQDMKASTVTVAGDIGAGTAHWVGSKELHLNDPTYNTGQKAAVVWNPGTSRKLTITVNTNGEKSTYSFTYSVFRGVCVKQDGDDGTDGMAGTPLATIQAGIAKALSMYGNPSEVHVAGGNYTVPATAANGIVMEGGISVIGGYDSKFLSLDWTANPTTVTDNRSANDGAVVFLGGKGITTSTVFEGFTVYAPSSGTTTSAIRIRSASPTIQNNILIAGGDATSANRYGINIDDASTATPSPVISGNTINSTTQGGGSLSAESIGIIIQVKSSAIISDNVIYAGAGVSATGDGCAAIYLTSPDLSSHVIVQRNTLYGANGGDTGYVSNAVVLVGGFNAGAIDIRNNLVITSGSGGTGERIGIYDGGGPVVARNNTVVFFSSGSLNQSYGIDLDFSSGSAAVDNNIFFYNVASSGSAAYCIYENQAVTPTSVKNNDLCTAGSPVSIYYDSPTGNFNLSQVNSISPPANNITTNALLDSTTFRPSASMPSGPKFGGIDGAAAGWGFSDDRDAKTRTGDGSTGWTMGCYEQD